MTSRDARHPTPETGHCTPDTVIAVTGANGYIGASLIRHLRIGANVPAESLRAVIRSSTGAALPADVPAKPFRLDYGDPSSLSSAFHGADAVVHLAGSLQPRRGETLYDANVESTRNVVIAAQSEGVSTLVYVSAPGASSDSPNDYLRSKGMAEDTVRAGGFKGAIFRVPMVLGRDSASLEALRQMASSRFVPLVMGGKVRVQPIARDDVIAAIRWALMCPAEPLVTVDLVGPDTLSYVDLLRRVSARLGKTPRVLTLPKGLVEASARVAAWVPVLGWNWSLFDMLFNEHLADSSAAQAMLPFGLTRVDALLDSALGMRRPDA